MGMRLGGAFPFNQAGAFPITLTGGEMVYPPPGNYLMTLGNQTVLQWWDPIQYSWRNFAQAAETFQISVDGYNWRLINMSGVVQAASITNAGSGGTNGIGPTQSGSTLSFAAGGTGKGSTAKGYVVVGGSVAAPTVTTAGGTSFSHLPLILVDAPPIGGIQATATCTLTAAGALSTITMVNAGAGYTVTPNFYVVPQFETYPGAPKDDPYGTASAAGVQNFPSGLIAGVPSGTSGLPPQSWSYGLSPAFPASAGAFLTPIALTGSATATGIVMTQYGFGYTAVPAITFGGTSLGAGAATSIMSWSLTALTGGSGVAYTVGNVWESTLGQLTATTTNFNNNNLLQARTARGTLTSTVGALNIEDAGFGFQKLLVAGNFGVAQGTSIGTTSIVFSAMTFGGVTDTSVIQMMVD